MCGIVGSTKGSADQALQSLAHRGPDQTGDFNDRDVYFGHQRLAIIDLSEGGRQPITSHDGSVTITYNGEIYNYRELKKELIAGGATFNTETDTEVIIEGYKKEGTAFFARLRGMWALALYDKTKDVVVLSRDYFGIKPLYYTTTHGLSFASEMKAFRELGVSLAPNTDHFYTFFSLGFFIAPQTCYKNIYALRPGEILTYDLKTKQAHSTQLPKIQPKESGGSEEEVIERLHEVLLDSTRAHFVSDVPVGILFSGGNDSALVAALALASGETPHAYHLSVEGSTDTAYAKQIAEHLELASESIAMTREELVDQYDAIWDIVDVPFADVSVIPTSLIYKKIGGRSKVVLSGEGGDEWFGGYLRHKRLAGMSNMRKENALLNISHALYGTSSLALRLLNPLLRRDRNMYFALADDVIAAYLSETKIIDYPLDEGKLRETLYDLYDNDPSPNLFFDRSMYLSNDLLFKNDIASMASSIEARVPFVDREVYTHILEQIPEDMCLSKKYQGKYLLKKVLEKYLPQELVHRDKKGFGFSFKTYQVPQFKDDVREATVFHNKHADMFGLAHNKTLLKEEHADIFIKKYPRFAFGLVSAHKIFQSKV